jgi:hypothetical protein
MKNELNESGAIDPNEPPKIPAAPTLQFSEKELMETVADLGELNLALQKAEARCAARHPIIVSLYVHGHRLRIGLGLPNSFVSIQRCVPTAGPAFLSIGDARVDRGAVFFFHGWRRTEIAARNLLPAAKAREILKEFFETGARPNHIDWEAL